MSFDIIENEIGNLFITNGHVAIPIDGRNIELLFESVNVGSNGVKNIEDVKDWCKTDVQSFCVETLGYSSITDALNDSAISIEFADLGY